MSKFRIGEINKKYKNYMILSSSSKRVSTYLEHLENMSEYNKVKTFVAFLKMLQMINKINRTGSFLLGHQQSETVLDVLSNVISKNCGLIFKEFNYTKFRDLNSDSSFHTIHSKIKTEGSEYKKYYDILWEWLLITDISQSDPKFKDNQEGRKEIIREIQIRSICVSQLLSFEINMVFSDWYGKNGFNERTYLPKNVRRYLHKEKMFFVNNEPALLITVYPEYFDRIFNRKVGLGY